MMHLNSASSLTSSIGYDDEDGNFYEILKPGERVLQKTHDILYVDLTDEKHCGTLRITNYRLIFHSGPPIYGDHCGGINPLRKVFVSMSRMNIKACNIMHIPDYHYSNNANRTNRSTVNQYSYIMQIQTRDLTKYEFLTKSDSAPLLPLCELLTNLNPTNLEDCPTYKIVESLKLSQEFLRSSWLTVCNPEKEFARQSVAENGWRITQINEKFELCNTYPRLLCVPKSADDDLVRGSAAFRSQCRFPVLCWIHPESRAAICRAAQPLSGIQDTQDALDERYVSHIRTANANDNVLYILDARPKVSSMTGHTPGAGVESPEFYESTRYISLNVPNIHAMRSSYGQVEALCHKRITSVVDNIQWHAQFAKTKWMNHIRKLLVCATAVVEKIENKTSVIVHCNDGCDRTTQICSLAMLLLDPYYRTIDGFQVLIEKEWCQMGHNFPRRLGFPWADKDAEQVSPVFQQFIDCVYQLTHQFSNAFEFNERFLLKILQELCTCTFGNFLLGSEFARIENKIYFKTLSLWDSINLRLSAYQNPFYMPESMSGIRALIPLQSSWTLKFWTTYYFRCNPLSKLPVSAEQNATLKSRMNAFLDACQQPIGRDTLTPM